MEKLYAPKNIYNLSVFLGKLVHTSILISNNSCLDNTIVLYSK